MSYVDFCCRSGGNNLNAGTRTGDSTIPGTTADFTYASGTWVAGTGVFTVASGDPAADGVAVGDYASVYADGATEAVFIGQVTARNSTTITVSLTVKMGTAPTDGTSNRTLKIGGAWAGPVAGSIFPFGLIDITVQANANDILCVNMKSDVTASVTFTFTVSKAGPYQVSGFGSTYRDKAGKWTLSGATSGASYVPLTVSGARAHWTDMIIVNNGATGTAGGLVASGGRTLLERISVSAIRGIGISATSVAKLIECETYNCNTSNTANLSGFSSSSNCTFIRCYSHDHSGANANGFGLTGSNVVCSLIDCIAESNGKSGLLINGGAVVAVCGCDFYGNVNGILNESAGAFAEVMNSNFVLNSTYGVRLTTQAAIMLHNCGFPAAGTTANGTDVSSTAGVISNEAPVTITANTTPWNAPGTGDFRITATSNKATGRGVFTSLGSGKTGTVAYPDVGAGQTAAGSGSAGIIVHPGMIGV